MVDFTAPFYLNYPIWWASLILPFGIGIFFYFLNVFRELWKERSSSDIHESL